MEERALALGGRLTVTSLPGQGTTIALECPLLERRARDLRSLTRTGTAATAAP